MSNLIPESEIEQLTDQELRLKFFEIFNALANGQALIQECEDMKAALNRIQVALYLRHHKPPS